MNLRLRLSLVVVLGWSVIPPAQALEWSKTQITAVPERGADVVRTKFEYKNTGKKTVHILEVKTSCGCTEATPESSNVAPGESGAVYVLFTIGKRTGLQEKEITILTDDSKVPARLTLKVNLPEAAAEAATTQK